MKKKILIGVAIFGVVALLGVIFGITLGVKFAKAEDTSARDEAKKQLTSFIIGIVIALVIGIVLLALVNGDVLSGLFKVD